MKPALLLIIAFNAVSAVALCRASDVPVVVNGKAILEKQLLAEIDSRINERAAAEAQKGLIYDESSRNETRDFMRDNVLHILIERQLIADQLRADRQEIAAAEVDARFVQEAQQHHQTPQEAEQTIARQGQTVQQIKDGLRQTMGVERLYRSHAPDSTDPTEASAKEFYDTNPNYFNQQEQRKVSRILFRVAPDAGLMVTTSAQSRADQVLQRAYAGDDFAALAKDYSEDETSKTRGGDRGWSARGWVKSPDDDPFGTVAFAMKRVGEISPVTRTQDGYEIIKLTGVKPARLPPFEEVRESILQQFRSRNIGTFWDQYGNALWAKADIKWSPDESARQKAKQERETAYVKKMDEQNARNAGN